MANYRPSNTGYKFHQSNAYVRGLMGPIGSGKSVTCVQELMNLALRIQKPHSDGIRRTRFAVVRNTYPELKSTTIKTFQDWFPVEICPIKFDTPISCHMQHKLPDKTLVDMEVFFLALDKEQDVKKLLSMELTAVWLNEAREIRKSIVDAATGRIGRYPPKRLGGPTRSCMIMDTNPPDDDHWWYHLAELDKPDNWQFFQQPPALLKDELGDWYGNPLAENVNNLSDGYQYWLNQIGGKTKQWIRVYIEGRYGTITDGMPVYPEFRDEVHISECLDPVDRPLILGWDFGLTPACIIAQVTLRGQLLIRSELVADRMGLSQFAELVVRPHLAEHYPDNPVGLSVGDPAGTAESQTDQQSCIQVLNDASIPTIPAPTNKIEPRLNAVRHFLTRMVDGMPGVLIDKRCKVIRKGFNGGYKYERVQVSGDDRFRDKPCKNRYSHPHDALQYLCLIAGREYDQPITPEHGYADAESSGYRPASYVGY